MTKELLKQYPMICMEIGEMKRKGDDSPRRMELESQKAQIEEFQQSLPEARQRLVVYLRAMQGLSWQHVAARMDGVYSVKHLQKIYRQAIKKYL